jgi:hypothetical protein
MNEITDTTDIKTALCLFFLHSGETAESVADDEITGFISYFGYAAAKAELLRDGFITQRGGSLKITTKGESWAKELGDSLPTEIKESVIKKAQDIKKAAETRRICRTSITDGEKIYINAEIGEADAPVMKFSLYVPDRENAENIEAAIMRDPFGIYKKIMGVIEKKDF